MKPLENTSFPLVSAMQLSNFTVLASNADYVFTQVSLKF